MAEGSICIICAHWNTQPDSDDTIIEMTSKGVGTLKAFCHKRQAIELLKAVEEKEKHPYSKIKVHKICRRNFTYPKRTSPPAVNQSTFSPKKKKLRSSVSFNWKEQCLICTSTAIYDERHHDRTDVQQARTIQIKDKLLKRCNERGDRLSLELQGRIHGCIDFVAAEAVYHRSCYQKFLSNTGSSASVGRPVKEDMTDIFDRVCCWLEEETETEVISLSQVHSKMLELSNEYTYSKTWLKKKLQERYGNHLHFSEIKGHPNVLCFTDMVSYIVNEKWYKEKRSNVNDEANRIVKTAAKLIREEIRQMPINNDTYPSANEIRNSNTGSNWRLSLLHTLISSLVPDKTKQATIEQCVIKANRPYSAIPPVLFGLAVECDHVFGSRWLIDELNRLGLCVSYSEVNRFKQSVVSAQNIYDPEVNKHPKTFTQFVADNVDHNLATLDGSGSFHGMGIIAVSTSHPGYRTFLRNRNVPREKYIKSSALVLNKGVPIKSYIGPAKSALSALVMTPYSEITSMTYEYKCDIDMIWKASWLFRDSSKPKVSWSGYMQQVSTGNYPGKSEVSFLPIIDLDPNDESCIYSTLLFVSEQAKSLMMPTPCITFDQPLWIKSMEIIKAIGLNVVTRLGGFHLLMSFLGSVGKLMESTGLKELLETVYGENTVQHMLTGKAYARSLRGHFLIHNALEILILRCISPDSVLTDTTGKNVFEEYPVDKEELIKLFDGVEHINQHDTDELMGIYDKLDRGESDSLTQFAVVEKLRLLSDKCKDTLSKQSRTAKLWILSMSYIDLVKDFIRAERTGDWNMHLNTVRKMLNLFSATGHLNYAKSARLYIQEMTTLPEEFPWLYQQFMSGFHTVRRSDRFWAGVWTDLTIEQALMRAIKSRGGLTRGRGMSEAVRLLWVHSSHKCAEIHEAMTDITNHKHKTSEQHVDLRPSRINRDFADLITIIKWLLSHNPFLPIDPNLRSLASGLSSTSADDGVNCDNAENVGEKIQNALDGKPFTDIKFKKSDYVTTMTNLQKGVKLSTETIHIDPSGLFSRLLAIIGRSNDIESYFQYELTQEPTSIFKEQMMRKPTKANLKNLLVENAESLDKIPNGKIIVDGGALLHQVKWIKATTYHDITDQYRQYLESRYGKCTVVFDGYDSGPSTKDHEHRRRIKTSSAYIKIHPSMSAHTDSSTFLSNSQNKSQFINLLSEHLRSFQHEVVQSPSDADTMIVKRALDFAASGDVITVIADDTDILVLLLHHYSEEMENIYLYSEASKRSKGGAKIFDIQNVISVNNPLVIKNILFLHAWSGCDTTSATYGQGKGVITKKIQSSIRLQHICQVFYEENASHIEIAQAGIEIFSLIYGGKIDESLAHLRFTTYMNLLATAKGQVKPERLPPTESAAENHSYRVHLQVIQWSKLMESSILPTDWGWRMLNQALAPVSMITEPAPAELLNVIRCKCKPTSKAPCSTNICTCRKNGIKCMAACGNCHGYECNNSVENAIQSNESSSDEELDRNIFDLFD